MIDAPLGPEHLPGAAVTVFLLALATALGSRIARHLVVDFVLILNWMAQGVVLVATLRLPRSHRRRWRREWLGELDALRSSSGTEPAFAPLLYALPLVFKAGGLSRELRPRPVLVRTSGASLVHHALGLGRWRSAEAARRRLMQRMAIVAFIATLLGLPGIRLGLELLAAPLESRPRAHVMRGIEGSEVTRDLLQERARFRLSGARGR